MWPHGPTDHARRSSGHEGTAAYVELEFFMFLVIASETQSSPSHLSPEKANIYTERLMLPSKGAVHNPRQTGFLFYAFPQTNSRTHLFLVLFPKP